MNPEYLIRRGHDQLDWDGYLNAPTVLAHCGQRMCVDKIESTIIALTPRCNQPDNYKAPGDQKAEHTCGTFHLGSRHTFVISCSLLVARAHAQLETDWAHMKVADSESCSLVGMANTDYRSEFSSRVLKYSCS
jgi:hypothetical protein